MKLNRKRLVVVLEDQIYVYDISNMKLLHTIETSPNPHGKSQTASHMFTTVAQLLRTRDLFDLSAFVSL